MKGLYLKGLIRLIGALTIPIGNPVGARAAKQGKFSITFSTCSRVKYCR